MPQYKPILINMPLKLLQQLDDAAKELSLCRSEMLRRCLQRDLTFVAGCQLNRFNEASHSTKRDYGQWSATLTNEIKE
jgi:metal-responsive CopG/Arc/MetJ family transcriptional regulator